MVPADDDHKDTHKVDSSASTKKRKRRRLTPMPDCLMHWWTPVLFAIILLAAGCFLASIWRMPLQPTSRQTIYPFWPPSWPFNYHWPSKDAMTLCVTIAGAGFAFSAWQQRSHDNIAREKDALAKQEAEKTARETAERNRREQIERDEYWKRREQIFQILASNNPGLRLGAVALLAELADKAEDSSLFNSTEKQQLQRHIIDTLCLQVRHEGLNQTREGTCDEHAEIQNVILQVILERIQHTAQENNCANWSEHEINLSNSIFLTPLTIKDIQTKATLDLQQSTFTKEVAIRNSKLKKLLWSDAHFHKSIDVSFTDKGTEISIDSIPENITAAYFTNCNIITSRILSIDFSQRNREGDHFPELNFENCTFRPASCECNNSCDCPHTDIHISNADKSRNPNQQTTTITLKKCTFHSLYLYFTTISSKVEILGNTIFNQLNIEFMPPKDAMDSANRPFASDARITIRDNKLVKGAQTQPIQITAENGQRISSILQVGNNIGQNPNDSQDERVITCSLLDENPLTFHFKEDSASSPLFNPWNTGQLTPPSSEIDNTATRWRLVTPFKAFHSLSKRFKNLYHTTQSS